MKKLVLVAGVSTCAAAITAILGACATDGTTPVTEPDAAPSTVPATDSGADAADAEDEGGACADCMYFPQTCTSDVLCPNGPFDPKGDGAGLSLMAQINVIRGRSTSDVWIAGALGALAHFDGTSWTVSDSGAEETLLALWLRDSSEVAFGRLDKIFTRGLTVEDAGAPSAGGWTLRDKTVAVGGYTPQMVKFESAWAAPGSEWLWCATTSRYSAMGPSFRDSGLWRLRLLPSSPPEIHRVLPRTECQFSPCSDILSVHGASADSLWGVGTTGSAVRINGAQSVTPSISVFNSQTWNALHGVWAASETEAWAVGVQGTIRRYTGDPQLWDVVADVPTKVDLHAVAGSSVSDVWAVGDDAVVLHYDGTSWSRVKVAGLEARRPKLTTIWVAAPGHVWIGGEGVVLSLGGKP